MGGDDATPTRGGGYESLTVAAVARMVGVAPSTLRTWARRYGLEPSEHRSGLHRRYSERDVARLRYMRGLTQSGMTSRDAAQRAMAATPEELSATPAPGRPLSLAGPTGVPVDGRRRPGPMQDWARPIEVTPAVATLLSTLGIADARGSTSLLRLALRDLGAARTWDERVLPARTAVRRLSPTAQERGEALLASSTVAAVGEVRLPRARRNAVPVHVVCLPGHDDPAARRLLVAALAERSIEVDALSLGLSAATAMRAVAAGVPGLLVVQVGEGPVASQLAGRLRQLGQGGDQVHWGEGWVHWPGQTGGMVDLVRVVEAATCPAAP
ncbi:MerR family transcriptional regulator [Arsenicicoccus sp. oral taxon 190]|uniref:MerR family transcriptional regulator n=1 Tax=Arsenicicoccus sp. oral taxon 190 TaxID=1658671 RepID=UPI00067D6D11|nr:MerR family transcriptional regulator [Arsenicicoccus sp. oral taxon 190]